MVLVYLALAVILAVCAFVKVCIGMRRKNQEAAPATTHPATLPEVNPPSCVDETSIPIPPPSYQEATAHYNETIGLQACAQYDHGQYPSNPSSPSPYSASPPHHVTVHTQSNVN
ncbi:hypothetical protein K493DRAFT_302631 [Basidiobolus meristosporus CBS 931.73]|uniref:Uncharacterized protein n=1 Tax=Basidiobolus meristosporus CBS 931.73 TaxID=1314790 RepID=A0A1Y1Y7C3_9FUNG|nr:hypothetical protein K493DRAFT_302631 [Basidiobolus meristosporus CBS 931.73]|eukprot:ORX93474.1 hypothetical protein K493DRAFT_302631 [Basidiobolus meristosporus CBS 931.73]